MFIKMKNENLIHISSFKPKDIFIGKSKVCHMTEFSGAANNTSDFDGNTLLL